LNTLNKTTSCRTITMEMICQMMQKIG
jgi:hypothetical protein